MSLPYDNRATRINLVRQTDVTDSPMEIWVRNPDGSIRAGFRILPGTIVIASPEGINVESSEGWTETTSPEVPYVKSMVAPKPVDPFDPVSNLVSFFQDGLVEFDTEEEPKELAEATTNFLSSNKDVLWNLAMKAELVGQVANWCRVHSIFEAVNAEDDGREHDHVPTWVRMGENVDGS